MSVLCQTSWVFVCERGFACMKWDTNVWNFFPQQDRELRPEELDGEMTYLQQLTVFLS